MSNLRRGDGWTFTDDHGQEQRRQRNPVGAVPLIDLDYASRPELQALVDHGRDVNPTTFARDLFPARPLHFRRTAMTLWRMAVAKLGDDPAKFERLYHTLPPYARYRSFFNVRACVIPGKKFRKHPPKT